ncbi:MAG: NAD(P)-dependent oxidoreductase [Planctomycetes bacterium]|nr:NAD(P)-dependent oxidoreductase [Planctomycetota bacterium]
MLKPAFAGDLGVFSTETAEAFQTLLRGRRVLVTGCGGFIGSHLTEALSGLGAEVHGLSRQARPACKLAQWWQVDLQNEQSTANAIAQIAPHTVFHLAASVTASPGKKYVIPMIRNNLIGTVNLLAQLAEQTCHRVVLLGSAEASVKGPPSSPYAAAKQAEARYAALFHHAYKLPTVVIHPTIIYGPGQVAEKLIPYVITRAINGQPLALQTPERVCDFLYINDLIHALLCAALRESIAGEEFEIGSGQGVMIRDVVQLVTASIGSDATLANQDSTDRHSQPLTIDGASSRVKLGWAPHWSLADGLRRTIAWHCEQLMAAQQTT